MASVRKPREMGLVITIIGGTSVAEKKKEGRKPPTKTCKTKKNKTTQGKAAAVRSGIQKRN